jgi:hypothetical protein
LTESSIGPMSERQQIQQLNLFGKQMWFFKTVMVIK